MTTISTLSTQKQVGRNIGCVLCQCFPITPFWYHCLPCRANICSNCESVAGNMGQHEKNHPLLKLSSCPDSVEKILEKYLSHSFKREERLEAKKDENNQQLTSAIQMRSKIEPESTEWFQLWYGGIGGAGSAFPTKRQGQTVRIKSVEKGEREENAEKKVEKLTFEKANTKQKQNRKNISLRLNAFDTMLMARYLGSVSLADGVRVKPNTILRKTWKVMNPGLTSWPNGTKLVCVGGYCLDTIDQNLLIECAPGEKQNIDFYFIAPSEGECVASQFMLQTMKGIRFGPILWLIINTTAK